MNNKLEFKELEFPSFDAVKSTTELNEKYNEIISEYNKDGLKLSPAGILDMYADCYIKEKSEILNKKIIV